MPLYELFALAKPGLGKAQLAQIMRAVGSQVLEAGGIITDLRSYGERRLAYDIRQPGARYREVGGGCRRPGALPPRAAGMHMHRASRPLFAPPAAAASPPACIAQRWL